MRKQWFRWLILLALTIAATIAAARFQRFPGDLEAAGLVQSVTGESVGWARVLTRSVSFPWNLIPLGLTAGLAWRLAGRRGLIIAFVSFGGLLLGEPYLKPVIARPRPAADLVRVFGSSSGYSFPSGFGMIFFSMFGYLAVLAWRRLTGNIRWGGVLVCCLILLIGGSARVALGAHWPSDILGAYLIGLTYVTLLLNLGKDTGSVRKTVINNQ